MSRETEGAYFGLYLISLRKSVLRTQIDIFLIE